MTGGTLTLAIYRYRNEAKYLHIILKRDITYCNNNNNHFRLRAIRATSNCRFHSQRYSPVVHVEVVSPSAVRLPQAGDSRPPPASQTPGASLVSQILQAGTVQQLLGPVKTVTMAAGVGRGHARMPATPAAAAAAVVGTTNIVVTQLPPGFTGRTGESPDRLKL